MATITWKVEDFRTGRFVSGVAASVTEAQSAAKTVIMRFGRMQLQGLLATVVRLSRLGTVELQNAKLEAGRLVWKKVDFDA